MRKTKDVFISYKRIDGETVAISLYNKLTEIGYSVFLDTEILQNGKYTEAIRERIVASTDFIVLVTPSFSNDDALSWIKKEYDWALESNSNIIPIYYTAHENISGLLNTINDYEGIDASEKDLDEIISILTGKLLIANQDITFKEDNSKDSVTNFIDYLERHSSKAFLEIALNCEYENEIDDSNQFLASLAKNSKYDIITCLWIVFHKCFATIKTIFDNNDPKLKIVQSLFDIIDDTLAQHAVLIDEGKLDSANRYFPELAKLLENTILPRIEEGMLD